MFLTALPRRPVRIAIDAGILDADLTLPADARALIVFAHGSGSSRLSSRNRRVARVLNDAGLATLLVDLLTPEEEVVDARTSRYRFDIELLTGRVVQAVEWTDRTPDLADLPLGLFGASTGAAAALAASIVTARRPFAIVSRGGRPDLAVDALPSVRVPTLLLVGALDIPVITLNRSAQWSMNCETRLTIVPGASHLFVEPGTLNSVADLAASWFVSHLPPVGADERARAREATRDVNSNR